MSCCLDGILCGGSRVVVEALDVGSAVEAVATTGLAIKGGREDVEECNLCRFLFFLRGLLRLLWDELEGGCLDVGIAFGFGRASLCAFSLAFSLAMVCLKAVSSSCSRSFLEPRNSFSTRRSNSSMALSLRYGSWGGSCSKCWDRSWWGGSCSKCWDRSWWKVGDMCRLFLCCVLCTRCCGCGCGCGLDCTCVGMSVKGILCCTLYSSFCSASGSASTS